MRTEPNADGRTVMRLGRWGLVCAVALIAQSGAASARESHGAEIRYTSHGVPHVTATTLEGAGYGYGWAFARDNMCLLLDRMTTLAGERSAAYGPEGSYRDSMTGADTLNLASDTVYRYLLTPRLVADVRRGASEDMRALVKGYVAGFNRHVAAAALPGEDCRGGPAFRPITEDDVWRRILHVPLLETTNLLLREIAAAAPPEAGAGKDPKPDTLALLEQRELLIAGSNAAAFGREMTQGGAGGFSFSNPHFGWRGTERLYAAQLTVPGKLDVFGGSPHGLPFPMMGFGKDVGWSVTHTTDKRSTIYELTLDPSDPRKYRVGDSVEAMRPVAISVPTKAGVVKRVIWETRYGPVIQSRQLPWTTVRAYAFADPERGNLRFADQFLDIARAGSVREIKAALDRHQGSPWSNVTAADSGGEAFYANISVAAHITDAQLKRCVIKGPARIFMDMADVTVLDGADPTCAWTLDPRAPQPGIIPAQMRPSMFRNDVVFNSNDSHWLATADVSGKLEGYPQVIGPEATARGERTRIAALYARSLGGAGPGGGGVSPAKWEGLFFSSRNVTAELVLDDVLADCRGRPNLTLATGAVVDLKPACGALARWDRTDRLASRGSALFGEFMRGLERVPMTGFALAPRYWRTPFDPADPIATPSGFVASDETRLALAKAADRLTKAGIGLEAPLGDVQFTTRGGGRLPLSGASYTYHMLVTDGPAAGVGMGEARVGDSYIHMVKLGPDGPSGRFIVTYSQAANPASPHHADMTEAFSEQRLLDVAFSPAEVAAGQIGDVVILER